MLRQLARAATILITTAAPALAHLNPAEHGSFAAGFSHPLFGLDHSGVGFGKATGRRIAHGAGALCAAAGIGLVLGVL